MNANDAQHLLEKFKRAPAKDGRQLWRLKSAECFCVCPQVAQLVEVWSTWTDLKAPASCCISYDNMVQSARTAEILNQNNKQVQLGNKHWYWAQLKNEWVHQVLVYKH